MDRKIARRLSLCQMYYVAAFDGEDRQPTDVFSATVAGRVAFSISGGAAFYADGEAIDAFAMAADSSAQLKPAISQIKMMRREVVENWPKKTKTGRFLYVEDDEVVQRGGVMKTYECIDQSFGTAWWMQISRKKILPASIMLHVPAESRDFLVAHFDNLLGDLNEYGLALGDTFDARRSGSVYDNGKNVVARCR